MQENSALHDDEMGVAGVSSHLYANVTKYHAQIGANVDRETLQQLEWNLLGEAKVLFHQRKFEEALNTFTHCLAVTEKTRSARDHAVRGAVIHNIASCLHNLGEMEAAKAYYEQAVDAFKKAYTPMLERMIYGNPNQRRIDFVKERLVDIAWGRKPDGDKYLDENGNKKPVPEAMTHGSESQAAEQALTERWREEGPPPMQEPRMPSWMNSTVHGPEYDAVPNRVTSADDYMPGFSGGYGGGSGGGGGGGGGRQQQPPRHEDPPPAHVSSSQYLKQPAGSSASANNEPYDPPGAPLADAEQEAARKEWLQYHLQVGEWAEAAELVVTQEERDDLEYLMSRENREGPGGGRGAAPRRQDEDDGEIM